MDDFLRWLEGEAPLPVLFLVGVFAGATVFLVFTVSAVALSSGYWIVPVFIWIILPAWFVGWSYIKSRKGKR